MPLASKVHERRVGLEHCGRGEIIPRPSGRGIHRIRHLLLVRRRRKKQNTRDRLVGRGPVERCDVPIIGGRSILREERAACGDHEGDEHSQGTHERFNLACSFFRLKAGATRLRRFAASTFAPRASMDKSARQAPRTSDLGPRTPDFGHL